MVKQSNQTDGLTDNLTELSLRDQVTVTTTHGEKIGTVISLEATPTTYYAEIRKFGTTDEFTIEKVSGFMPKIYESDDDTPNGHNVKDVELND